MASSHYHPKMKSEDRAKQFMPFAALKGYEEALRRVEIEHDLKNGIIDENSPTISDTDYPENVEENY